MAAEQARQGGEDGAYEEHHGDDCGGVDTYYLGHILVVANGADRPAKGGPLEKVQQPQETGDGYANGENVEALYVGPGHGPRIAA